MIRCLIVAWLAVSAGYLIGLWHALYGCDAPLDSRQTGPRPPLGDDDAR